MTRKGIIMKNIEDIKTMSVDMWTYREFPNVKVINICEWLTEFYGEEYWTNAWLDKDDTLFDDITAFCNANNCLFYSAPREDFSLFTACRLATEKDCEYVIVEDLS